jgi:hypothetical protein
MKNWVFIGWLILCVAITLCGTISYMSGWMWLWDNVFYLGAAFIVFWFVYNVFLRKRRG